MNTRDIKELTGLSVLLLKMVFVLPEAMSILLT